jgi:hypothetical protein
MRRNFKLTHYQPLQPIVPSIGNNWNRAARPCIHPDAVRLGKLPGRRSTSGCRRILRDDLVVRLRDSGCQEGGETQESRQSVP